MFPPLKPSNMYLAKYYHKNTRATQELFEQDGKPLNTPNDLIKMGQIFYRTKTVNPQMPGEDHVAPVKILQQHGTTTVGFIFKGGIILSVDSRSTMGGYISSNNVHKVIPITKEILGTIAGGAADCEFWERSLSQECKTYEYENGCQIGVSGASKLFNTMLQQKARGNVSVGAMLAGHDEDGSAHLYYCDISGNRLEGVLFGVGSGSSFAYAILENGYHWDMTDDQAIDLGLRSVMHAAHRDAMSGGMQNVYLIKPDKWQQVKHIDGYELYRGIFGGEKLPRAVE